MMNCNTCQQALPESCIRQTCTNCRRRRRSRASTGPTFDPAKRAALLRELEQCSPIGPEGGGRHARAIMKAAERLANKRTFTGAATLRTVYGIGSLTRTAPNRLRATLAGWALEWVV